jgi:AraC-like DNA-binding protein
MTLTTRHAEIDHALLENFDIRNCANPREPEREFDLSSGVAICFEFDYPDRPGLELLRSTKARFPHVPILMLTTQHSERLAVWAYRNRVMDYLVKPVSADDVARCQQLLATIQKTDRRQNKRVIVDFRSRIPAEIPVGQRGGGVRLAPAVHFVEKNFREKIRNDDVAGLCDMSSSHFSHAFKESFTLTFQEFVLRYRIFEACKELRHPNVPIANVAFSVGFNDPSYFARVFRRYVGWSPSEFCDQMNGSDSEIIMTELSAKLELPELTTLKPERKQRDRWPVSIDRIG